MAEKVSRVGVVGAGQMGGGIAEVAARAGADVLVWEATDELANAGKARILKSLDRAVSSGKLTEGQRTQAAERLRFTTDFADFADRQLVVEAIVENEAIKADVFAKLDAVITDPDAVLASNTSSLPIQRIATATKNPGRVLGLHFFNPVPVLPLVEVIPSQTTSEAAVQRAHQFAEEVLGKQVVRATDRSGFIVNALLVPYLLSAIRMYESGFATAEDIDKAMVLGTAHPMGPLKLADLVGLDTVKFIADAMHQEYKEATYAAPPLLLRLVEAGYLGKKAGRGFYDYS